MAYSSSAPWDITRLAQRLMGVAPTGVWDAATDRAYIGAPPQVRARIDREIKTSGLSLSSIVLVTSKTTEKGQIPPKFIPVKAERPNAAQNPALFVKSDTKGGAAVVFRKPKLTQLSSSSPPAVEKHVRALLTAEGYPSVIVSRIISQIRQESNFRFNATESHNYSRNPSAARRMAGFKGMSDAQIVSVVEQGPEVFFEMAYGSTTTKGKELGNVQPGDGFKFRGRGLLQETGRFNYNRLGLKVGVDLVTDPDWISRSVGNSVQALMGSVDIRFGSRKQTMTEVDVLRSVNPGLA